MPPRERRGSIIITACEQHYAPPVFRHEALLALEQSLAEDSSTFNNRRDNAAADAQRAKIESEGSGFVEHVLYPLLTGYARRSALEDALPSRNRRHRRDVIKERGQGSSAELVQADWEFLSNILIAPYGSLFFPSGSRGGAYVASREVETELRELGLYDRLCNDHGVQIAFDPGDVDIVERIVQAMAHTLLEHPVRCLVHVLRPAAALAADARTLGVALDVEEMAREAIKDYFDMQLRIVSALGALIDVSRGALFSCASEGGDDVDMQEEARGSRGLRLRFAGNIQSVGAGGEAPRRSSAGESECDAWLYRPLATHSDALSIVFLLCDGVYACLKSSAVAYGLDVGLWSDVKTKEDVAMAVDCVRGRAAEMRALCHELVSALETHRWCLEDVPLLYQLMDLYDILCLHAWPAQQQPAHQTHNEMQKQCRGCAVMVGAVLTRVLANLPSFLALTTPPSLAPSVSEDETSSVLEGLAERVGGVDGGSVQSGAMSHMQLLLACAQMQAQERWVRDGRRSGAYGLGILERLPKRDLECGLMHTLQLLRASKEEGEGGRGGPSSKQMLVSAVAEVWGVVLEVVRCWGHAQTQSLTGHAPKDEAPSVNVVVSGVGNVSWPTVEATQLLFDMLPQATLRAFASWNLNAQLASWTSEAIAFATGAGGVGGLAVKDAASMEGVMKAAYAVIGLFGSIFEALQLCAQQAQQAKTPGLNVDVCDASDLWTTARGLFVLLQDALPSLQASPTLLVENLDAYASCLGALTAVIPAHEFGEKGIGRSADSGWGRGVGYAASHLTAQVFGSEHGDSSGTCFRGSQVIGMVDRGAEGEWAAGYEGQLVKFCTVVLRVLHGMAFWAVQFEAGKDIDSAHPMSQDSLGFLTNALMRLWLRPLPSEIKAEMVRVLTSLVTHSTAANIGRGFVANVLDVFVTRCLVPPITFRDASHEVEGGRGDGQVDSQNVDQHSPSALLYELSLLDRTRGRYEHTLAVLGLLTALSRSGIGALTTQESLRLLEMCLPLLPSTSSASIDEVFRIPAQRWQVTQAMFNWASVVLNRVLPSDKVAARSGALKDEVVMVLSWLLRNSGLLGDMQDSDSERGLYVSAVDLIALGMKFASAVAANDADDKDASLKHLSQCLDSAIEMVSLAIQVAGGDGCGEPGNGGDGNMLEDLKECVLDVLCGGWSMSPFEAFHLEPVRVRALSSLLQYAALPDEPALSARALRILSCLSSIATRDENLVHALLYDSSVPQQIAVTRGLGSWLERSLVEFEAVSNHAESEDGLAACDVAALVLRLLIRSLATLRATAEHKGCEQRDVVRDPAKYGGNLALALLGLYEIQGGDANRHLLLRTLLRVTRAVSWPRISHLEIHVQPDVARANNQICDMRLYHVAHNCMHVLFTLCSSELLPFSLADAGKSRQESSRIEESPSPPRHLDAVDNGTVIVAGVETGEEDAREEEWEEWLLVLESMWSSWGQGLEGSKCLSQGREEVAYLRTGKWLGQDVADEILVLFGEGLLHCTQVEAVRRWQRGAEVIAHLVPAQQVPSLLDSYLAARARIQNVEEWLEDAVDGQLLFLHHTGWLLRMLAVVLQSSDPSWIRHCFTEERGGEVGAGSGKGSSRLGAIFQMVVGSAPADTSKSPQSPYRSSKKRAEDVRGCLWRGQVGEWGQGALHGIVKQVLNLHAVEGAAGWSVENECIHSVLSSQDLQGCFTLKDAWSGQPICYDTHTLIDVLAARLTEAMSGGSGAGGSGWRSQPLAAGPDDPVDAATACVDARALSPYDGYNTLQRLQSARQHVLCGIRDVVGSILGHLLPPEGEEDGEKGIVSGRNALSRIKGAVTGGADGPDHVWPLFGFLYNLVQSYLLPLFPSEKAGANLEVGVHTSVLIRQTVEGICSLRLSVGDAPGGFEGEAGAGRRVGQVSNSRCRPLEPLGSAAEKLRHRDMLVRERLLRLLDTILALLQRWGQFVPEKGAQGGVDSATQVQIASQLIRRQMYTSVLALIALLAPGRGKVSRKAFGEVVEVGADVEKVLADHRASLLPVVMADVLLPDMEEERSKTRLVALRSLVYILPLAAADMAGASYMPVVSTYAANAAASPSSLSHTKTSFSMSRSSVQREGGGVNIGVHSQAGRVVALRTLLQQFPLGTFLAADFAGKTKLADVLHGGLLSDDDEDHETLLMFLAKVQLLTTLAAQTTSCEYLRHAGVVQTICATPLLSSFMTTRASVSSLLHPPSQRRADLADLAETPDRRGVAYSEELCAHQIVLGSLEALISVLLGGLGGNVRRSGASLVGSQVRGGSVAQVGSGIGVSVMGWSGVGCEGGGGGGIIGWSGIGEDFGGAEVDKDFVASCAESLLRFVWTNREVLKAILDAPLSASSSTLMDERGGVSPYCIVPYADPGLPGSRESRGRGEGVGALQAEYAVLSDYLNKERALTTQLFDLMAQSGILDLHVPPPGPDSQQVKESLVRWLVAKPSRVTNSVRLLSEDGSLALRLLSRAREILEAHQRLSATALISETCGVEQQDVEEEMVLGALEHVVAVLLQRADKGEVVLNAASLCSELLGAPQARASYTNMAGGGWAEGEEELGLEFAHFVATSLDFLEGLSLVGEKEDSEGSMFASQMGRKKNDVDSNGAWVKVMELGYRLHEAEQRYDNIAKRLALNRKNLANEYGRLILLESEKREHEARLAELELEESALKTEISNLDNISLLRSRQSRLKNLCERTCRLSQNCLSLLVFHCCSFPRANGSSAPGLDSSVSGRTIARGEGNARFLLWSRHDESGLAQRLDKFCRERREEGGSATGSIRTNWPQVQRDCNALRSLQA